MALDLDYSAALLKAQMDAITTTVGNASASGTPTWWRIAASGAAAGAAGFIDGTAGQSGTAGVDYEMIIGATTSGQPVNVTAFTITSGT